MKSQWNDKILTASGAGMESLALEQFRFQYDQNQLYRQYSDTLKANPSNIRSLSQIPFLPIRFFKSHAIKSGSFEPEIVFESSGTTGTSSSKHYIRDMDLYRKIFSAGFRHFYGSPKDWCIIGLLPSYLERQNSSLVFMADELIRQSGHSSGGFYLDEFEKLNRVVSELEQKQQPVLLIGVTFALLDFAEKYSSGNNPALRHTIIMETGGMKGRREEMIREEVHARLKTAFGVSTIHSEYGMTELLSQAYSKGQGLFQPSPWMKIMIRDEEDPLQVQSTGTGAINIVDLGNIWSCSFIATDDAGKLYPDGSFEILGRLDNSDLRGCSLLTL